LKPATIQTFESSVGYSYRKYFRLRASIYYFFTDNEIVLDEKSTKRWQNAASRDGYGAEIEMFGFLHNLFLDSSFSYYHTDGIDKGIGAPIYPKVKINFYAEYNLGSFYLWNRNILRAFSKREEFDTRENLNDTVDLQLGFRYKLSDYISFTASGKNLLGQDIKDATPSEYVIEGDLPTFPRSVWVGFSGSYE